MTTELQDSLQKAYVVHQGIGRREGHAQMYNAVKLTAPAPDEPAELYRMRLLEKLMDMRTSI